VNLLGHFRAQHELEGRKIDFAQKGEPVRKVADIQAKSHQCPSKCEVESTPLWIKMLLGIGLKYGPFEYSLAWLEMQRRSPDAKTQSE
jgi:hypothetical protein